MKLKFDADFVCKYSEAHEVGENKPCYHLYKMVQSFKNCAEDFLSHNWDTDANYVISEILENMVEDIKKLDKILSKERKKGRR